MKATETSLTHEIEVRVRFSEVDPIAVVWHGSYVAYLEDAREAWGKRYGLGYMDFYRNGFFVPIYDLQLHYRHAATIDDLLIVKITYCKTIGSKLVFHYEIRNKRDNTTILTAESVQLFTTTKGEFYPQIPDFYNQWIESHL